MKKNINKLENSKTKLRENIKKLPLKKIYLIFLPIIFIVALYFVITPKITLKGDSVIEVEYLKDYIEKGASANFLGKDITSNIKIESDVETSKVGEYKVTYTVDEFLYPIQKTRTVKVVDKKKPTIELVGDKKVIVCPGKKYEEEGYSANDEYDGNLTNKVDRLEQEDYILYKVADSSNNKTKVKRKILYEDKILPSIDLGGMDTYHMTLGTNYEDPGVSASDNCDGDITQNISVDNGVNNQIEGSYVVTYTVRDTAGNEVKVERKVIVSKKIDVNSGAIKNGVIYLTFDDGPNAITTPTILDILKEEKVKATFFVTNSGPDELIKREDDEGHTVALHTATHDYAQVYASVDAYFNDLQAVHDRVYRITGKDARIIRFPGGSSNTISRRYSEGIMSIITEEVLSRGYRYYDWNISSGDAGGTTLASGVYQNVVNNLSKDRPNMILMHDIKTHTRDALRDIIRYGKENGYSFEAITSNTAMVRQRVNN